MTERPAPISQRPTRDPRVAVAKRVVFWVGAFALVSVTVATVFGAYHCATERPARELLLGPAPGEDHGPAPEAPLPR